jgi:pSer/pThr/pTyr-binding forkhead associated (FHA) protein
MLGKLVPTGGGPPIPLLKPKLLIGRKAACDIPLGHPSVSGRHCELELRDGYWWMNDLGSSNGTRINGVVCTEGWLMPNDVLSVARQGYTVCYAPPAHRAVPIAARQGSAAAAPGGVGTRKVAPLGPLPRAGQASTLGQLVPCGGGKPILLNKESLLVGRQTGCDIVISDPSVSGRHCHLEHKSGSWFVRDLDSRNGTRVNGVFCKSERLPPGAVLAIAAVRYRVLYTATAEAPAPAAPGDVMAKGLLEKAGLTDWMPGEEE